MLLLLHLIEAHATHPATNGVCQVPSQQLSNSSSVVCAGSLTCVDQPPATQAKPTDVVQCWLDAHAPGHEEEHDVTHPPNEEWAVPGDDLQAAMDRLAGQGGGVLHLRRGQFVLHTPLVMRSGVELAGAGRGPVTVPAGAPGQASVRWPGPASSSPMKQGDTQSKDGGGKGNDDAAIDFTELIPTPVSYTHLTLPTILLV